MSIVERALKKARKDTRPANPDPAPVAAAADAEPQVRTQQSHAVTGESTSRAADDSFDLAGSLPRVELDFDRLRAEGRVPSSSLARQTDDEIRRIKWPLLQRIEGAGSEPRARNRSILVTSALPGEGKTFVSLGLALSIVRDRELKVILVDGDVARPGLTPSFGLADAPGLNDVLDDPSLDVASVTYQTNVDGLLFVPAGKYHELAAELIAGSSMERLFGALTERVGQGVIIIDSPPLLATNEAQVATRYAGQVLLVVHADSTPQRAVRDALSLVEKSTPVTAVLNRVQGSALSRYYGNYYYRQGYGRGYERPSGSGKGNA